MPLFVKPIGGTALKRPPPANPRYKDVKPQVDSGFNELKAKDLCADRQVNARFQRGENFRRIKASRLQELLSEQGVEVLLLDLRDEDAFEAFHLTGAVSYPARMLSRAMNPFTPEILAFRNHPKNIIIVHDLDERIAAPAANLMFEKGVDNVYLLTGGLHAVVARCPELLEGPSIPQPPRRSSRDSRNATARSSVSRGSSAKSFQSLQSTSSGWR
ncbi:hypothetical protein WJX72_008187 [[Myrmecia] bisecta]|uniref:Rhodanese domain-containing protein n=1 Tax=[Myrmecia] bisecta TaxID=41462 RepID=A0AAW1R8H2_9CHLO